MTTVGGGAERLGRFERGFEDTERAAAAALKSGSVLVSAARELQKSAADGDLAKLKRACDKLGLALENARQETANARSAWPFSAQEEEAYLNDGYQDELLSTAAAEGLRIESRDNTLVAFPSLVRIIPSERAVKVDKKKVSAIRPSHLVALLKTNQSKKSRFPSERFLEALYKGYRLKVGRDGHGSTVALVDLYEAFTLLPGANAEYDQSDFGRDIFLLDSSGLTQTRAGTRFTLTASTATKGGRGTFTFVGPTGETAVFSGIKFHSQS
ncbi:MAG: hypothetical protein WEB00_12165 [Dehalococcoidia bacterium]